MNYGADWIYLTELPPDSQTFDWLSVALMGTLESATGDNDVARPVVSILIMKGGMSYATSYITASWLASNTCAPGVGCTPAR